MGDRGDLLTGYDGQTITYDEVGNPTSYYNGTRWSFGWEHGRQLATASDGTTDISYTYDADGLRTSKTVDGVVYNYYYSGDKLVRLSYGDVVMDFFYDAEGRPYAMKYNNTKLYYVLNAQGDVVKLVTAGGDSYGIYTYDAWGRIIYATDNQWMNANPLRYRGYVYDTETELYYLQSRYYDPEIGRFINADAHQYMGIDGTLQSYNLFAYCSNDPVNHSDATGRNPVISGLIGAGIAAVCSLISGERGWAVLDSAIQGFIAGAIPIAGVIISLNDSVELGIDVAERTGNDLYGIIAFGLNLGVSSFTGKNFSKLKIVENMDEAAILFFDAVFGFLANIFHTQTMEEVFQETVPEPSKQAIPDTSSKPSSSRRKY